MLRDRRQWSHDAVARSLDLFQPPGLPPITWVLSLSEGKLAVYRDGAFLECRVRDIFSLHPDP